MTVDTRRSTAAARFQVYVVIEGNRHRHDVLMWIYGTDMEL